MVMLKHWRHPLSPSKRQTSRARKAIIGCITCSQSSVGASHIKLCVFVCRPSMWVVYEWQPIWFFHGSRSESRSASWSSLPVQLGWRDFGIGLVGTLQRYSTFLGGKRSSDQLVECRVNNYFDYTKTYMQIHSPNIYFQESKVHL